MGLNNIVTMVNNAGLKPAVIKGGAPGTSNNTTRSSAPGTQVSRTSRV
ncbi:MAG: hypothetical protein ACFFAS_04890 [Promethearchaeota archaeon]